jgi:hypothetical protein
MPSFYESPRRLAVLGWFFAGVLVALAGQMSFAAQSEDGLAGLLMVGSENPLLGQIETELGPLHPAGPLGHDGQISYLIARDPFNRHATATRMRELDQAPYRYRRVFYSLVAGGFGLFPGGVTMIGLVVWAAVGVGLGTGAAADISHRLGLRGWVAPATLVNLGVLLSAVMLTSDALALGLGLVGIALAGRSRVAWAALFVTLAALTKETYLLFAWAVAGWLWLTGKRQAALAMAVLPVLPLLAWTVWVSSSTGGVAPALHHFALPGTGIVEAVPAWLASRPVGTTMALGGATALLVLGSLVVSLLKGDRLLALCCGAWALLGLVLSVNVWEVPTNALRVLAPLWPVVLLALAAAGMTRRTARSPG